jgi:hypothetical protein
VCAISSCVAGVVPLSTSSPSLSPSLPPSLSTLQVVCVASIRCTSLPPPPNPTFIDYHAWQEDDATYFFGTGGVGGGDGDGQYYDQEAGSYGQGAGGWPQDSAWAWGASAGVGGDLGWLPEGGFDDGSADGDGEADDVGPVGGREGGVPYRASAYAEEVEEGQEGDDGATEGMLSGDEHDRSFELSPARGMPWSSPVGAQAGAVSSPLHDPVLQVSPPGPAGQS